MEKKWIGDDLTGDDDWKYHARNLQTLPEGFISEERNLWTKDADKRYEADVKPWDNQNNKEVGTRSDQCLPSEHEEPINAWDPRQYKPKNDDQWKKECAASYKLKRENSLKYMDQK